MTDEAKEYMDRAKLARARRRITARKYQGDDAYSWAVFLDGRPVVTGLNKSQVRYYREQIAREIVK